MLVYRIFAAYTYDDRHLIAAYDFSDPIIFRNYLEEVFSIRQIDAFIDSPHVTGFCYTQLTDVEQEKNGIYYYDRTPKLDMKRIKAIFEKIK